MKDIKPVNYDIVFEPDLNNFKFRGRETIQLEVKKATKKIVLNSLELKINECHMRQKNKILKPQIKLDDKKQELLLMFPSNISGNADLFIEFEGVLNDNLVGFYRSRYLIDGKEKYLATTQFEAADARRAFPCWDHPEYKATFDVSVVLDKKLTAISNTPVKSEKSFDDHKKIVRFERTPIMSTYLLYMGVGELEFVEYKLGDVVIRVYTTSGKKDQGKLALEFTKKFLKYYEKYFEIKYPLKKLDFIAVPDFSSGAMENWGAITFRETALLFDPNNSSTATKQRIAEVISHEIAHMWFGNLVTMRWWNDLWLNESFATFMATKVVDKFYPEWDLWNQFLDQSTDVALKLDALKTSHPIEVKVNAPSEIAEIFDEISYEKGGNILKMLESYLGEEVFRKGLINYLESHKYGNATTEDLWSALEKVSQKPVREMMTGWVRQTGYPLIDFKIRNTQIDLTQRRFVLEGGAPTKELWFIPLSIKSEDVDITHLLKKRSDVINLHKMPRWLKINFGQNGFYRVKYQKNEFEKLKKLIIEKKLPNVDRWGIQNDLFALTVAREISVSDYLDFVKAYSNESDYLTCSDIQDNLYFIYLITFNEKFCGKIKEFNKLFFRKRFEKLGWEPKKNEKHTDTLLRGVTLIYLGRSGDKEILKIGREKFNSFLKKPSSLHPDIRSAAYNLVAWNGDEDMHQNFVELYRKAGTQEEKIRFLAALSGFQNTKLLNKTLDFSLLSDVRSQDIIFPLAYAGNNPYGIGIVWPWIKKNWNELEGRLGKTKMLLRRVISLKSSADHQTYNDMKKFFQKNPVPEIDRALDQTLERIRINVKFLAAIKKSFS